MLYVPHPACSPMIYSENRDTLGCTLLEGFFFFHNFAVLYQLFNVLYIQQPFSLHNSLTKYSSVPVLYGENITSYIALYKSEYKYKYFYFAP